MSDVIGPALASQPRGHSLQQPLYTSDEAFRRDVEHIFMRHWCLAGHASLAPRAGDYFLYEIAEESVIVVRGKDGELRAFANVCRHRGSRICKDKQGHAKVLVCPYHAWAYELDGSLRAARYMPEDFDKSRHGLQPIHIAVIEGLVFISLADRPLSLEVARKAITGAYAPYGWGRAAVAHRETYLFDANWKLAVENYLECYHCAPAHPEYSELHALERPADQISDMTSAMEARTRGLGIAVPSIDHRVGSRSGEASVYIFRYPLHDGFRTGAPGGRPVAPLMGDFRDYDGGVTSTHLAPASFFIAYPDHGVLYRFIPLAARKSALEISWLVADGARAGIDYELDRLAWLWRVTTEADKRITEDNQSGVNSRFYRPGPYAPFEVNTTRWIAWYLEEVSSGLE